jgi:hypothetical protein
MGRPRINPRPRNKKAEKTARRAIAMKMFACLHGTAGRGWQKRRSPVDDKSKNKFSIKILAIIFKICNNIFVN